MPLLRSVVFLSSAFVVGALVACGAGETTPTTNPVGGPINTGGTPNTSASSTAGKPDVKKTNTEGKPDLTKTNGPSAPTGGPINLGGLPDLSKSGLGGKDGGK